MSNIEIEIDGKKIKTQPNKMVIQVADAEGIYIPRFCYHKHLTVAANCRMCLVEVEKSPKTLPACATPVVPGMKIFTRSPKALAAQRAVMEFLLINHPLDCPICDQGGECELQDLSMGYGKADSNYVEGKRAIKDEDLGPLIETEMTRCIQCTRCVRFGSEIAGMQELGVIARGEENEISTYVEQALHSEVSGNIIDLCPVGALTSKPFRFTARAWELEQFPSISPHDCLGSNIYIHTLSSKVMRTVPRENNDINLTWISDRDRFGYEGLYHTDRLTKPLVRKKGKWQETDWQTALEHAATSIQSIVDQYGANQFAALASPNSTVEEFYLLQKLSRALGSSNVDHRLRQVDFSNQHAISPGFFVNTENEKSRTIFEIANCDVIVLVGSNIQKEQPVAALHVRKASLNGARIISINMMDYRFNFKVNAKKIAAPHQFPHALADLDNSIAKLIAEGKKVGVLVGALAINHPQASIICELARKLAEQCQGLFGILTEGANAKGAWLAGMVPHYGPAGENIQQGLDAQAMLSQPRKGYLLMNVEPDLDCANPELTTRALESAESVVALSLYKNAVLNEHADVILPMAPFTETSGTFVNVTGEWQSFKGVATGWGESRPAWKILRVMGNLLHCEGFDFETSEEVRQELKQKVVHMQPMRATGYQFNSEKLQVQAGFSRVGEIPIYAGDSLVRRAKSLQSIQPVIEGQLVCARINPETAAKLNVKETEWVTVKQNGSRERLPVMFDGRVPPDAVWVPGGILATQRLPELFGMVDIEKIT